MQEWRQPRVCGECYHAHATRADAIRCDQDGDLYDVKARACPLFSDRSQDLENRRESLPERTRAEINQHERD